MGQEANALRCQESRLLQSFRAIGLIVDDLPFVWYGMGKDSFLTASLKKAFVVYKCDKLTPVLVSPQLPKKILAIEVLPKKHLTLTACGRSILVWKRVTQIASLDGHKSKLKQLLVVGSVLFSLDEGGHLCLWDLDSLEKINELTFDEGFTPSVLMHPSTYLNKILVGSEEGAMHLWNINTMQCIYQFKSKGSAVTCLSQSPAVDVVGVGLADGRVFMHNLLYDKTLMEFHQADQRITSISFRTDRGKASKSSEPCALLATSSSSGDIAIWNLQTKKLETVVSAAHDGSISKLWFLPNEPLLISSGSDNALKMWIFDQNQQAMPRLLKSREGHKAPPTRIRYYGNNTMASMRDGSDGTCCQILSAGQDRAFRVFHTALEQQSTELSQGNVLKRAKKMRIVVDQLKLPPILQFAAMETRQRDWCNMVTCHEQEIAAYVWRFEQRAIGKHILRQFDPSDRVTPGSEEEKRRLGTKATCVAISTCGNFAIVGSIGGGLYKYNMQSGEKRGSFPKVLTPAPKWIRSLTLPGMQLPDAKAKAQLEEEEARQMQWLHDGMVTGVVVDALNRQVISGGIDGRIKFWDFQKHSLLAEMELQSSVHQLELHRDSNLLCVACDDQVLRVFDVTTRKLVRRFGGHTHRISDVVFSPDARWLFSSSSDATLRVWDVPNGKCIDWVKFHKPVTGIAISPTGEFLATTHVGHVGIYLWANRAFFTDVFCDSEPEKPVEMDLPVAQREEENGQASGSIEANPQLVVARDERQDKPDPDQVVDDTPLADQLITLSKTPRAFWQSLFHLELIKKRNKPIQPPKAPEKAPFFLMTARKDDVHPTFVGVAPTDATKKNQNAGQDKGEKDDEPSMEGWGATDDDDTWGDLPEEEDPSDTDKKTNQSKAATSSSRILKSDGLVSSRCKLAQILQQVHSISEEPSAGSDDSKSQACSQVFGYLEKLSASAIDVELSTLCLGDFDEVGKALLSVFLDVLATQLTSQRAFQVCQAYLNRFLKLYDQLLVQDATLLRKTVAIGTAQEIQWRHLQQLLHNNLCLVHYFSNLQIPTMEEVIIGAPSSDRLIDRLVAFCAQTEIEACFQSFYDKNATRFVGLDVEDEKPHHVQQLFHEEQEYELLFEQVIQRFLQEEEIECEQFAAHCEQLRSNVRIANRASADREAEVKEDEDTQQNHMAHRNLSMVLSALDFDWFCDTMRHHAIQLNLAEKAACDMGF